MMRREYGYAAHFIGSLRCMYHRTTQVGELLISTVGDYRPRGDSVDDRETIGHQRYFETMVFHIYGICSCGCGLPEHNGENIDFAGYQTAAEAEAGHEAMCAAYETIQAPPSAAEA